MKCTDSVKTFETTELGLGSSLEFTIPSTINTERGTKCKVTERTCASKEMKSNDVTAVNSDVVFVSDVISEKQKVQSKNHL